MKFTNQSTAGAARARSLKGREQSVAEPTYRAAPRVDPSVCIEPLRGEIRGAVDMDVTIGKPRAYRPNNAKP